MAKKVLKSKLKGGKGDGGKGGGKGGKRGRKAGKGAGKGSKGAGKGSKGAGKGTKKGSGGKGRGRSKLADRRAKRERSDAAARAGDAGAVRGASKGSGKGGGAGGRKKRMHRGQLADIRPERAETRPQKGVDVAERGTKRKADGEKKRADGGEKRKAGGGKQVVKPKAKVKVWRKPKAKTEDGEADDGKKGKRLTARQKRRKEVTGLYSELINPGRTRKADVVVAEILELLKQRKGALSEYCSKLIGSRVVQACLKWGSHEQRQHLLTTFKDDIPKMSQDRYGHVVVLKLLRYGTRTSSERKPSEQEKKVQAQNLKMILEGFHGKNLHSTFFHRNGCRVINGIYFSEAVNAKEKRRLLHDVAVPQAVALTRPELPGSRALRQLLTAEDIPQDQRNSMMEHLRDAAERAVEKELLAFDIVHLLFQAYCEVANEKQLRELADKCMAGAPYLLSSKPGAEAMLRLLGVANAKERKALCRDLKGKFPALAKNAVDYVVMIRLAMTVDDTVLLTKSMLAELIADIDELCFDKYGHKVLAWILQPADPHLFSPYERTCVALPAPAAIKAPETRRQELVRAIRPSIRGVLLARPLEAAADLHAKDLLVAYLASGWDAEVVEALVAAGEAEADSNADFGLLGNGTAITTLLVLLKLEPPDAESALAAPLWRRCFESRLVAAATSRCAFVLLALLKREKADAVRKALLTALRRQRKEIVAAAESVEASGGKAAGCRKLLTALDEAAG